VSEQKPLVDKLRELVGAERRARELHDALRGHPRAELLRALRGAIDRASEPQAEEPELSLLCVARLLGELHGPEVVDALVDVLGSPHPLAKLEAGEQLQGLALEHFPDVADGVERALRRLPADSSALVELPYLLVDTQHPDVTALLGKALGHAHPDVVAAAIESLAAFGDPAAIELLEPWRRDSRRSTLGDEDEGERFEATVGELAEDAIELLRAVPGAEAGPGGP
jgi:hypothetical protein